MTMTIDLFFVCAVQRAKVPTRESEQGENETKNVLNKSTRQHKKEREMIMPLFSLGNRGNFYSVNLWHIFLSTLSKIAHNDHNAISVTGCYVRSFLSA